MGSSAKLITKNSEIRGSGVFAKLPIKKDTIFHTIAGDRINFKEVEKRIAAGVLRYDDPFQIGDELYIDCEELSRTFNHSCNPNSAVVNECDMIAIRDIEEGEEVTFDYSTTVGINKSWWKMPCNCQETECRKIISSVLEIPHSRLDYYYSNNLLPDFIIKQLTAYRKKIG